MLVLVTMVMLYFPGGQSQDVGAGHGCRDLKVWLLSVKNVQFSSSLIIGCGVLVSMVMLCFQDVSAHLGCCGF